MINNNNNSELLAADLKNEKFRNEYQKRKRTDIILKIPPTELEKYQADGYKLHKSYRNHLVITKPKSISEQMEDRIWLMLFKMGFAELNPSNFSVPTALNDSNRKKQIDIVAKDEKEVIFIECKASHEATTKSMRSEIAEFGSLKRSLEKYAKSLAGPDARIALILALQNINLSENDRSDAKGFNILIWNENDIDYCEKLADLIGHAAKYQLFANIFQDVKFPEEIEAIPAISGQMGNFRFYTFCMTPAKLLKIAYVHHRFAHRTGENPYQRMLNKNKLKKIDEFLSTGRFFPNNIIINFTRKPQFFVNNTIGNMQFGFLKPAPYYASAWIIDGQHRLYGYANHPRKESDLLQITAFEDMNDEEQGTMFVEINQNQKAVEANLLWDLYSEIYQNSASPNLQLLCTISKIAKNLNHQKGSPFYNRIYIPSENIRSDDINITIQTICTAIKRNRLCTPIRRNKLLAEEMLFRENFETTENFATKRIIGFFTIISQKLAEDWKKGERGFSSSNNGIATLFIVLKETIRYAKYIDKIDNFNKWIDVCNEVLDPVLEYIQKMNALECDKLRGRASSEGQRLEIARIFITEIRKKIPGFAQDFEIQEEETADEEETKDNINNTELNLRRFILQKLISVYGENEWYSRGIPEDVKKVIEERKQKDIAKYPYKKQEYAERPSLLLDLTDIVHLGRIITWDNNKEIFSSIFINSEETKRRIEEFQSYRNSIYHNRQIDDVAEKTGKASMEWIQKCLNITNQ